MPKVDGIAVLAQKLLIALEQRRQENSDYPLTVARLAALADPLATPDQVNKALGKKPFAAKWLIAKKKDPNSPIALADDGERLTASPMLLEFALDQLCDADHSLHTAAKIVGRLEKALRPAFKAALERRIDENALPPTVGVLRVKNKPQLYLRQFPPPKDPSEKLSEKLVQVLTEQRQRGADAYPPSLDRLIAETGIAATPTAMKKALGLEPFRSQTVLAMPSRPDSLVALVADAELLASSPTLLPRVLAATRTADNQAMTIADLKKKIIGSLQESFVASVNHFLLGGLLPDGVGVLRIKTKPLLFLLADLHTAPPRPREIAPLVKPAPADFAHLFDVAFARLDHEHGSHNHVSLVELRRAIPTDRISFDVELQQLRRAGRYSLSAAEGRHGINAEEQDAGIREDGSLLVFVSRRER